MSGGNNTYTKPSMKIPVMAAFSLGLRIRRHTSMMGRLRTSTSETAFTEPSVKAAYLLMLFAPNFFTADDLPGGKSNGGHGVA
jgi:hypothetical protein